jgi:maltooligosyltrehalose trehalohydrolase
MTRFGPDFQEGSTTFRLWAPNGREVRLLRPEGEPLTMTRDGDGFFTTAAEVEPGQRYRFEVDGLAVPDPASRAQDGDVDGWSVLTPPAQANRARAVRPWHEAVIAEVHVGTATPEGTFAALAGRLPHFIDAGYTVIELMPVADFPGRWNWGYDGVLLFAPDEVYGTPADLRRLVDAAHGAGLGIMLDVVYNHFGPSGNYLHHYASDFFTDKVQTPWGAAIDLSNPIVRRFFVENAVMWLRDYDFDGLRFDAVHAFPEDGGDTLLGEIAEACRRVKTDAYLVLENDDNAARWLVRDGREPRAYTAQWNDDIHHALHVAATGQRSGYYEDYAEDPAAALLRCLSEGFAYQGEPSAHRGGSPRGEASAGLPPEAFVAFAQNHDQIGNRPFGDRLAASLDRDRQAALEAVVMLSPQIPMFFMGEEAGVTTPFPFFCDFAGDLAEAVRAGRRREFAGFFEDHAGSVEDLPDPLSEDTVRSAKLPWEVMAGAEGSARLERFRGLAELRRRLVWPLLHSGHKATSAERSASAILVTWDFHGGRLALAVNLADEVAEIAAPDGAPAHVTGTADLHDGRVALGPWSVAVWGPAR